MTTVPELIQALLDSVPALRPLYDQHIEFHEELLPHVFFGDVSRLVEGCFEADGVADEEPARAVLAVLEAAMEAPSEDVDNLIGVSFIENVAWTATPRLRDAMGPRLQQILRECIEWRPSSDIDSPG